MKAKESILVVDLKMPGMDGLQVLAQARTLQPDAAVIIMTAYATMDTAVQAMKQGTYDYLVKPFEPEELSLMVGKLTSTQALRRENVLLRKALKHQCEFKDLVSKSPKKGAFTGAVGSARGKFEIAAGGTLFLDEIGDISPKLQLDLLRERKEDIPLLVEHFLAQFRTEMRKPLEGLSGEALELPMAYDWPGNVRELRNVLERGAVLARGPILTPLELELGAPAAPAGGSGEMADSLREVERRHIVATLRQHHWNITRSAKALGIDRVTLYNKIKRYQIREDE